MIFYSTIFERKKKLKETETKSKFLSAFSRWWFQVGCRNCDKFFYEMQEKRKKKIKIYANWWLFSIIKLVLDLASFHSISTQRWEALEVCWTDKIKERILEKKRKRYLSTYIHIFLLLLSIEVERCITRYISTFLYLEDMKLNFFL